MSSQGEAEAIAEAQTLGSMPEHRGHVRWCRKPPLLHQLTFVTSQAWILGSPSSALRSAEDDEAEGAAGVDETGAYTSRINDFLEFHPRARDRRHNAR